MTVGYCRLLEQKTQKTNIVPYFFVQLKIIRNKFFNGKWLQLLVSLNLIAVGIMKTKQSYIITLYFLVLWSESHTQQDLLSNFLYPFHSFLCFQRIPDTLSYLK